MTATTATTAMLTPIPSRRRLLGAAAVATLTWPLSGRTAPPSDPAAWARLQAEARGQTVRFNAWAGVSLAMGGSTPKASAVSITTFFGTAPMPFGWVLGMNSIG